MKKQSIKGTSPSFKASPTQPYKQQQLNKDEWLTLEELKHQNIKHPQTGTTTHKQAQSLLFKTAKYKK